MRNVPSYLMIIVMLILLFTTATAANTINKNEKVALLTFDDGPDIRNTPEILDILKRHDIKGMFFVTGQACSKQPDLLRRIANEGHVIANHTFNHKVIKGLGTEQITEEITLTNKTITRLTNQPVEYFRPPTGAYSKKEAELINELGLKVLMWDCGLEKVAIKTPKGLVNHLLGRIEGQDQLMLLLHDGSPRNRYSRKNTVKALPILIEELKARGYKFIDPSSKKGKQFIDRYIQENPKLDVY
ncbi:MAG: polysaccharide deacetylase family protein [Firmicutes bacterium]|nr:polysaccharide deacetylase family protein [Bacillota bacterium]